MAGPDVPIGGPDVLIGAVATEYWHAKKPAPYRELASIDRTNPWWFPAAWYGFLRSARGTRDEAARWLAWFDRLSDEAPDDQGADGGWRPEWSLDDGTAQLAVQHIRYRAGSIAAACRAGRLPDERYWPGWRDGAWDYHLPVGEFPAGFVQAWRRLPDRFRPGSGEFKPLSR
ncbi:MAG: hypothetical protein ACR2GE_11085 [Pseudonocardia sp.]